MTKTESPDDLLPSGQAARAYGVQPETWRTMVKRGQAPDPDHIEPLTGHKFWKRATVIRARDTKPGRGHRSDLTRRCIVTDAKAGLHKGRDNWCLMTKTPFGAVLLKERICDGHAPWVKAMLAQSGFRTDANGNPRSVVPWPRRTATAA